MGPEARSQPPGSGAQSQQAPEDTLGELDRILQQRSRHERELAEQQTETDAEQVRFLEEFAAVCEREVRPAMEAVLDRLRQNGGGGLIQERSGGEGRSATPRVTLWMSLDGEIAGSPRQDRHPYLQLDADHVERQVEVWEGDMWHGAGSTRRVAPWHLSEITKDSVTEVIIDIVRRAAR